MASIRKLGAAVILAAVMAGGLGTTSLEAAGKKKGGDDAQAAICSYLWSVMTYPYVNAFILASAASLYTEYGCSVQ